MFPGLGGTPPEHRACRDEPGVIHHHERRQQPDWFVVGYLYVLAVLDLIWDLFPAPTAHVLGKLQLRLGNHRTDLHGHLVDLGRDDRV